jgi:hypothetical protein
MLDNIEDKDWIKNIQQGKGKDIAREFFVTFTTQERVSEILYPNRKKKGKGKKAKLIHFSEPIIKRKCKDWRELGFLEKSRPITFKDRWGRPQKVYWRIMNFNPIFKYCEEKGIVFSEEEKNSLLFQFYFKSDKIRKAILQENPNDDVITASLKFYVKNCIMKYLFYLRDIHENPMKYKRFEEKAKELNNPTTPEGIRMKKYSEKLNKDISKKFNLPYNKDDFRIIDLIAQENFVINYSSVNHLFSEYIRETERNKLLVYSVDKKILMALGLL